MADGKHSSLIKVASHKIDRSKRGVKSEMVQKYVGKEFKIDDKKAAPPKMKPVKTGETYEQQLKKMKSQNEELKKQLEQSNAGKEEAEKSYNALLKDYQSLQKDYVFKEKGVEKLESVIAEMDKEMTEMKKVKQSVDTSVIVLDDYLVKVGKVFVDADHHLGQSYLDVGCLDHNKAKDVSDFTGGKIYQMAIVPYGGEIE